MKKNIYFLTIIFTAITLSSCATPTYNRMYGGEPLPKDQVAFLIARNPYLYSVDGKKIKRSFMREAAKVELLPGRHTIEVGFHFWIGDTKYFSEENEVLEFSAEPGHTYLLELIMFTGNKWRPIIRDLTKIGED